MQNLLNLVLRRRRKNLFEYPTQGKMPQFTTVLQEVAKLPMQTQSLNVNFTHNSKEERLVGSYNVLQPGDKNRPRIIYMPWYGSTSAQARWVLSGKVHAGWTHEGIDLFSTIENFNVILATARGSQYGYAFGLRLLEERIKDAHKNGQKVGVVGLSYGANLMNAYVSHGFELPDAMVAIEGGSIVRSTLGPAFRKKSDPKTIAEIERDPSTMPAQLPLSAKASVISAAVINTADEVVKGQEELWGNAGNKMYLEGSHFLVPIFNLSKIRKFTNEHLKKKLQS